MLCFLTALHGRGLTAGPALARSGRGRALSLRAAEAAPTAATAHLPADVQLPAGSQPPTAEDVAALELQIGHSLPMVGAPESKCKHGFPQAIVLHPWGGSKMGNGLTRLTCPMLVQAIDAWEAEDAIGEFNARMRDGEFGGPAELCVHVAWRRRDHPFRRHRHSPLPASQRANADVAAAKQRMCPEGTPAFVAAETAVGIRAVRGALGSGIAGMTIAHDVPDVKCLHAQAADFICRGDNAIGEAVMDRLRTERGVDTCGTASCREQCAGVEGGWRYRPEKNKLGLQLRRERRAALKKKVRLLRAEQAAASVDDRGGA